LQRLQAHEEPVIELLCGKSYDGYVHLVAMWIIQHPPHGRFGQGVHQMDLQTVTARLQSEVTKYGLNVSPRAMEILAQCVFAIQDDPEPSWASPPSNPESVQENVIPGLALKLARLVHVMTQRGIPLPENRLTTFLILHNMSSWIDHLCPFEKPAGQAGGTPPAR
jgi:hypothetical protein